MRRISVLLVFAILFIVAAKAQNKVTDKEKETAYTQAINARADKIVTTLAINDTAKAARVKTIIANHYRALNDIQTRSDLQIKEAKSQSAENKEVINAKVKNYQDTADAEVANLHAKFIKYLSNELTGQQVDKVKDGLTYNVTLITYNGYLAMIPTLTDKQKEQIMAWLIEAREHAMDLGSSEKKHAWFGKYKGRINNYLSAAGYDLKKEGEEWEKRRKAAETAAKN